MGRKKANERWVDIDSDLSPVVEFLNFDFGGVPLDPSQLHPALHRPVVDLFYGLESEEFWAGKTVLVDDGFLDGGRRLPAREWMPEWIWHLRELRLHLICALIPRIVFGPQRIHLDRGDVRVTEVPNPTEQDWRLWKSEYVAAGLSLHHLIKEAKIEHLPIFVTGERFLLQRTAKVNSTTGSLVWGKARRVLNKELLRLHSGHKKNRLPHGDVIYREIPVNLKTPEQKVLLPIKVSLHKGEFGNLKFCQCGSFYLRRHGNEKSCDKCKRTPAQISKDWRNRQPPELNMGSIRVAAGALTRKPHRRARELKVKRRPRALKAGSRSF